jgi:diaminopimelate epimerase
MHLTKHEALGNDFLVVLDRHGDLRLSGDEARSLCDRHRGIGADGLLRAAPHHDRDVDVVMELFNADGSLAEMSGNGIRCLTQAVLEARLAQPPVVRVMTDAGLKHVAVGDRTGPRTQTFTVDMGAVKLGDEEPEWVEGEVLRAVRADAGNPHVVLHVAASGAGPEPATLGQEIDAMTPGGMNVHFLAAGPEPGAITVRSWERGVGETLACGTGACAAAAAAHLWELAGTHVTVHMPGGTEEVVVGDTVTLRGPATSIAAIEWPWP